MRLEISAKDLFEAAKVISQNNPVVHQRKFSVVELSALLAEQLGLIDELPPGPYRTAARQV